MKVVLILCFAWVPKWSLQSNITACILVKFPETCHLWGRLYIFFFSCPAFFFNAIKRISCEQLHGFVIRGFGCHNFQTDEDYIVWTAEWQNENTNLNNKTNKGKKEIVYPALAYFSVAFGCLCSFPRLY